MSNKATMILVWSVIVLIVAGTIFLLVKENAKPGALDGFATCLRNKGAVFYGAFWCPHCQKQKAMFGKSQKLLSYVECSTPDGKRQLPICQEKNITGYPTWEFTDGSRETGEVPLKTLSEKTGCELLTDPTN